jgi:uncharacterized low-complexity protein
MSTSNKSLALAVAGALALTIGAASVNAAGNPFAIKSLSSGYQVADADTTKMKDGKCGTGKCGAGMKKGTESATEKAAEGSCHGDMKAKEGSCHGDMKATEGSCHGDMKAKEGSCNH